MRRYVAVQESGFGYFPPSAATPNYDRNAPNNGHEKEDVWNRV
jgi:hypothetical protein